MKNLLLLVVFILAIPFCASANPSTYDYSFYGESVTGVGSATMNVSLNGKLLTATLNNISPLTWGDSAYTNTSGITGFGFFLDEDNLAIGPAINSWTLTAYDSLSSFLTIGSIDDSSLPWSLDYNQGFVGVDFLEYYAHTSGVGSALYNPSAEDGFASNPYFTEAILSIELVDDSLTFGDGAGAFVRMQNVGSSGADSLKLFDYYEDGGIPPQGVIPEPSTLILLGAGLIGLAVYRRKKD